MKIGFIGTGKITASVISGICRSSIKYKEIWVSARNRKIAKSLKKKYVKIFISESNQKIINECSWIFLAITPEVGEIILKNLKFKSNQIIVSFISTISLLRLKNLIKVKSTIVRAIPLPPISIKEGPVPICPPNKKVKAFFDQLGSTVEIKNEKLSINFWSTSGMMASYYNMLDTMSVWLNKRGIKKLDAQKYVTSLFLALSKDAVINSDKDLKLLVKDSQTPKGLNEQGLKEMIKQDVYKSLINSLDGIYKRLDK